MINKTMTDIATEVFEALDDVANVEMIGAHPSSGEVFVVKNSPIKMYQDMGFSFNEIMTAATRRPIQLNFS